MKTVKTLLAASILAAAGTVHATTVATFNGTTATSLIVPFLVDDPWNYPTYELVQLVNPGSGIGTASGVLDDRGTFTIIAHVHLETIVGTNNDLDIRDILTGTWDGTTFTATGGTHEYTGCIENTLNVPACSNLLAGGLQPVLASGSITLAGGSVSATSFYQTPNTTTATTTFAYTFGAGTPAAVPEPSAAWLFGSGLIGLASATHRRRSV